MSSNSDSQLNNPRKHTLTHSVYKIRLRSRINTEKKRKEILAKYNPNLTFMDIRSASSEDNLIQDRRHERRRIKSAPSARRIHEDFIKNLSDIKLESLSSEISKMPKTIPQKQATATLAGTQDAATPATLQASATQAATESPGTSEWC